MRQEYDPTDLDNEISEEDKIIERAKFVFGHKELEFKDHPALDMLDESSKLLLAGHMQVAMETSMPWRRVADAKPNLKWYTPTCTAEDWKHKDVLLEIGQGIAYITLNRPESNNTLNDTIMHGLLDAVFAMHNRPDVRIVCFCSTGSIYCGGQDPEAMASVKAGKFDLDDDGSKNRKPVKKKAQDPATAKVFAQLCEEAKANGAFPDGVIIEDQVRECMLWHTLTRLPQISIAMVQGSVIGTGICIPACTDMCYTVKNSFFCMPDLKKGLVPAIMMPHLCQKLGPSNARYVCCTASNLTPQECKGLGLVNEIEDDEPGIHAKLAVLCENCTGCGPRSVEACKELINGVAGNAITEKIMFFTGGMLAKVTVSKEAAEAMVCLQTKQPKPWEAKPITPFK